MERQPRIELGSLAWKAKVLPLNYCRRGGVSTGWVQAYESSPSLWFLVTPSCLIANPVEGGLAAGFPAATFSFDGIH